MSPILSMARRSRWASKVAQMIEECCCPNTANSRTKSQGISEKSELKPVEERTNTTAPLERLPAAIMREQIDGARQKHEAKLEEAHNRRMSNARGADSELRAQLAAKHKRERQILDAKLTKSEINLARMLLDTDENAFEELALTPCGETDLEEAHNVCSTVLFDSSLTHHHVHWRL